MGIDKPISTHSVKFTLDLPVPPQAAWRTLTQSVDAWWPRDYRAGPEGSRMQLTAALGGQLLEATDDGNGIVWYQVIALDAPKSITMAGFIAPPFGGPATTLLRLTIIGERAARSALEVHDSLLGVVDADSVEAGWRAIFGRFAKHVAR
jgi:uncharacterized protein YndB with AHSA1/START domain